MPKKTIVTSILQSGVPSFAASYFRVGAIPINAEGLPCTGADADNTEPVFPPVEKIEFCRHAFGKGAQVDQPCYIVTLENSPEKVVIRADEFCQSTVAVIEADTVEVNVPNMPQ